MYIGVPLYALSSCHPVNPPVAIECVGPCRACEYFNVLSIYRAEHVFQREHLDVSVINAALNFSRDANLLESSTEPPESRRSRLTHGTIRSAESRDKKYTFEFSIFRGLPKSSRIKILPAWATFRRHSRVQNRFKCHSVTDKPFVCVRNESEIRRLIRRQSRVVWILQYEIDRLHETHVS